MISTPANLYKCGDCSRQIYASDIEEGKPCICGSNRAKYLQYTKLRFIKALLFDKKVRSMYWNENLRRGRISVYKG